MAHRTAIAGFQVPRARSLLEAGATEQVAGSELLTVDAAMLDLAACDARHLGKVLPPPGAQSAANETAAALSQS